MHAHAAREDFTRPGMLCRACSKLHAWGFDRLPSLRLLSRCSSGGKAMV